MYATAHEVSSVTERWECCDSAKRWSGFPPMPASTKWHRPTCPTLEPYPFRDLSPTPSCDKCAGTDIATTYHKGQWWEFKNHHTDPWRSDLGTWSCLLTWNYRPEEHLDRSCRTCSFGWLERTAS